MKKKFLQINAVKILSLFAFFMLFLKLGNAQTVISTASSYTANNGSGLVTFNLQNTNGYAIEITEVMCPVNSVAASEAVFWTRPTPISAANPPGTISVAGGWTLADSNVFNAPIGNGTTPEVVFSNSSIIIPANTTVACAIGVWGYPGRTPGRQRYMTMTTSTTPTTFTNGGVTLITGDNISYAYTSTTASPINLRGFVGSITFKPATPPAPNDAGVTEVTSPVAFCAGPNDIKVKVKNFGTNVINNVQVQWSMNGTPQTPVNLNLPLDTIGGSGINEREVTLAANYNFTSAPIDFKAWTNQPNSTNDTSNLNDTITATLKSSLSGTFTINSAVATGGTNYQTFTAFINDLNTYGVCGPVIANVNASSGPYNEILKFQEIPGASAINTIRINGNGRTVQYSCDANNRQLVQLIGTKYLTLDSLNFISQNATYGWAAVINGGASYDSITRCNFNMSATTSTASANTSGICFSGSLTAATTAGANAKHCYIGGNTIQGPTSNNGYYYALTLTGGADSNIIEGNTFANFYFYGVYMAANAGANKIINNNIHRSTKTATTTFYGIYSTGAKPGGLEITNNRIHSPGGVNGGTGTFYGMYISSPGTDSLFVTNNAIYNINQGGTSYAFYLLTPGNNSLIAHNTIHYDYAKTGTDRGFYISGIATSNAYLMNNIISFTATGTSAKHGYYFASTNGFPQANVQRNNVYFASTAGGNKYHSYNGGNFANLAALQAAYPSMEQGSLEVDPQYTNVALGNFLPTNVALKSNGINLTGFVPLDILGTLRNTLPTPGAWEIPSTPGPDAGVQDLISPSSVFCSNQQPIEVSVINSGTVPLSNFQIHWTLNGNPQTPFNYTGTLPIFGQGQYIDTVTIGNINIPSGNNTIKVWTVVTGDVNHLNDTFASTITPSEFTVNTTSDTICYGKDAHLSLTPNSGYATGMIQWQKSTNGTTYNIIPNSDQPVWTESNVTSNTWFRAFINSGTGGCYSDTTSVFVINPTITSTTPDFTCGPGAVTLSATSSPGTVIEWYDVATGGTPLDTGSTFTTPNLTATTTYYAVAKSGSGSGDVPELMYYKFDVPGNSVANEASNPVGNNPATITGLTIGGTGQFGTGLQGNAGATATNRVDPGWTGTHTGSWTISFWMNVPTPPTTRYMFGNSSGNGTFRCFIGGAANGIRLTGGMPSITLDMPAWTPGASVVTYVYDQSAGTVSGYINGVFQASATPGASYPLDGNNFVVGSQGTSIEGIMDEFRMYSRALTAAEVAAVYNTQLGGCEGARVPVVATVNTPVTPAVNLGPDTGMCLGLTINLDAGSYPTGYTYLWDNSSNNQIRTVGSTGIYHVTVTAPNGCKSSDTIFVNASSDFTVDLGNDTTVCDGNVLVLDAGNPNYIFLWDDNSTNQTRNILTSGIYYVTVTNTFGCEAYDTIAVLFNPTPSLDLGNDTTTCINDPITLDAGNPGATYIWNDNSTNQTILATNPGTYYVTVTNNFDCSVSDTIEIFAELMPNGNFDMNEWPGMITGKYTFVAQNLENVTHYEWDFGDGSPRQTGSPINYEYQTTGTFTVSLHLYNECNTEVIISKTKTVLVGVDDIVKDNEIAIYPNPASENLTIENKAQSKIQSILIYDALGRIVKQIDDLEPNAQSIIELSNWSNGIYSVVINSGNNIFTRKITIIK